MKTEIKMKNIFINLMLAAALLIASCQESTEKKEEAGHHDEGSEEITTDVVGITEQQFKVAGIQLGLIEDKNLTEVIRSSGTLDVPPSNFAEVSTYIGGVVKSINVLEGDQVKKGQTIITLEHPDFIKLQEEYIAAKTNIDFLLKEYERQKELYNEKVSSGKVFQEAESKYNSAKGKLASLQSQLEMLSISTNELDKGNITKVISLRSPINGFIGHVHTSLGAFAEPNKMLFDVIDISHIHVHLEVFEKDLYKIKIGQKINIILPNQNNKRNEGEIFSIGKMMDSKTKSIAVHAEIKNNQDNQLIPGTFVNALINVTERSVPSVPTEAIVRSGEKQYIFIVTEDECENPNKTESKEEECKDTCCADKKAVVKEEDDCCKKDANGNEVCENEGVALTYKMIEVMAGASDLGYTEITPSVNIPKGTQIVTKGAYFLMSQLKSGETVGCCAPGEEEKKDKVEMDSHGH